MQAEALILGIPGHTQPLSGVLAEADQALDGAIATVLKGRTFKGKPGDLETLFPMKGLGAPRIVLVGLGEEVEVPLGRCQPRGRVKVELKLVVG